MRIENVKSWVRVCEMLASVRQGEDVHVDVRELLQTWKIKEIDLDNFQKIVVSRQPRSLWEHSLRCFNRENFKLNQTLKVEFRNECGEDEGGLRREYLEILLRQMLKSSYFEEIEDSGYEVSFNMIGLIEAHTRQSGKCWPLSLFKEVLLLHFCPMQWCHMAIWAKKQHL
ncbi:unnamed protein product [Mytilus coruscus]|uniref:HECT domain-containing protein n=1 Tax=Mytilus coruscus TaxID=42192 RepID=A0A6J7ZWN2_MYTCO|nr:unnamed protein product [Mytilus coruscus]